MMRDERCRIRGAWIWTARGQLNRLNSQNLTLTRYGRLMRLQKIVDTVSTPSIRHPLVFEQPIS